VGRQAILAIATIAAVSFLTPPLKAQSTKDELRHFPEKFFNSLELPFDVDVNRVRKLDAAGKIEIAQREFDIFSWQTFLALNAPIEGNTRGGAGKGLADDSSDRVWSTWRPAQTIFLTDGKAPERWGSADTDAKSIDLYKSKAAWRQHVTNADENFQAFSGPLVDQNGKWVRYEVLVDHEEFDYLLQNKLYSLDGQRAFSAKTRDNRVDFPTNNPLLHRHGAIEIKLAWKELGPNDDPSRFFVRHVHATLSEPAKPGQAGPATRDYDAGLVGMHIALRTRSSPEWIWATFEQVDNERVNHKANGQSVRPNFFNPGSTEPVNVLAPKNAVIDPATGMPVPAPNPAEATTWIESLTTQPVQVQRVAVPTQLQLNDLDARLASGAAALNSEVQAALQRRKSVFQYYELIGTQWPIEPAAPAFTGGQGSAPESIRQKTPGSMVPVFLVNTTMETFFQKGQQPAGPLEQDDRLANGSPPIDNTQVTGTESCVGCHYSAGVAIGFKRNNDGSYQTVSGSRQKVAIFGEMGNFGQNGNAMFSWLLQIEAQSEPVPPMGNAAPPAAPRAASPAKFLDILRLNSGLGH
jgi:hypothetical protein